MKIEAVKSINITALFSSPINHLLISPKSLLELVKIKKQKKVSHSFIEVPGVKIMIFPGYKKEFVFEANRVLVNDKSEVVPKKSDIVKYFLKIIGASIVEKDKMTAYGFNYNIVIAPDKNNLEIKDLIGKKIAEIVDIKKAGIDISFEKKNIIYRLNIEPIGNNKKFIAHFNAHFESKLLSSDALKNSLNLQFEELKKIVKKI